MAVVQAAARIARLWTADQLARAGAAGQPVAAELADSVVLVVSELVTNAIAAVTRDVTASQEAAIRAAKERALPGQILSFGDLASDPGAAGLPGQPIPPDSEVLPGPLASPTQPAPAGAVITPVQAGSALPDLAPDSVLPAGSLLPLPPALPPTSARCSLVIARLCGIVRIEVRDSSRAPLPPTCRRDAEDETGRGLQVVAALAQTWGWQPEPFGKVVWCELAG